MLKKRVCSSDPRTTILYTTTDDSIEMMVFYLTSLLFVAIQGTCDTQMPFFRKYGKLTNDRTKQLSMKLYMIQPYIMLESSGWFKGQDCIFSLLL